MEYVFTGYQITIPQSLCLYPLETEVSPGELWWRIIGSVQVKNTHGHRLCNWSFYAHNNFIWKLLWNNALIIQLHLVCFQSTTTVNDACFFVFSPSLLSLLLTVTCTVTSVTLWLYSTRTDHVSGLFLLFPLCVSISHNDMGLICGGGVNEAQPEGLSLYSAQPHTCKHPHTHTHKDNLGWIGRRRSF